MAADDFDGRGRCATDTGTIVDRKAVQDAAAGTAVGAAAGAVLDSGHRGRGALIGAAVGGISGGLVGEYLERHAKQIEDAMPGANVERHEQHLVVTLPGDVLFDSGSASLSAGAGERLQAFAQTLRDNRDTDVVVKGYTDAQGTEAYNLALSQRRAEAVREALVADGVAGSRITAIGMGEADPIAANDTLEGRRQNRRVQFERHPDAALHASQQQG